MKQASLFRLRLMLLAALLCSAGVVFENQLLGSDPPARLELTAPAYHPEDKFLGVKECHLCHRRGAEDNAWVRLDEVHRWESMDRHSQAYKTLESERSATMIEILRRSDRGWSDKPAYQQDRCLNCHALNCPVELRGERFEISNGIGCGACHGPSERWLIQHHRTNWRTESEEKKQSLGMIPLQNPAVKTKLCLSCHLGNTAEGKVVTHEMYAAGHPILPGFEVETYSDLEPPHWRTLHQKLLELGADDEKEREQIEKVIKARNKDFADYERATTVLVGGVIGLRQTVMLLGTQAHLADEALHRPKKDGVSSDMPAWPRLAQFDCAACHHDLRQPSWRIRRGFTGKPGRPGIRQWPTALTKLAIVHLGRTPDEADEEIAKGLKPLREALDQQPFGRPERIAAAADTVLAWADQLLKEINAKKLDDAAAERLLSEICLLGGKEILDFDSARQLAWAYRVTSEEMAQRSRMEPTSAESSILAQLNKELYLGLAPGRERKQTAIEAKEWATDYATRLQARMDYDPERVQKLFARLAAR
ncbi:hypothetical protein Pan216_39150 [Planctomycetes bacterium Pan216]|uniref:Cytochrome c-552/4 domain-containing protein n=1 Tax=Kolteria novifilia TaxID=2527975 RepID=A0A518B7V0_9BACT|nr:hypothetical protein Pan216_39150 [Planctomycetes bacterium Pan216]